MNILTPYDTFNDVHAFSASYWCRDKSSYDRKPYVDPGGQPCDPDVDPPEEGGHGGGSSGGGHGGGSSGSGGGGNWGGSDLPLDPPENADLGGDEDTPQW